MKQHNFDKFQGSAQYIAAEPLKQAVNVSLALGRPLLIKGEPGTGKTLLAHSIAEGLGLKLLIWNIKSTTKARDGCYVYDTVQRLNDSRFGDKDVADIRQYIKLGPLGQAFLAAGQVVLLIDEIDKADIEFPNDLLNELDIMSFQVPETGETVTARERPAVVITSNNEKELPLAFLRRCIFHYIEFPDERLMAEIVHVHYPQIKENLLRACLAVFYKLRAVEDLRKKPSTSELLDWLGAMQKGGLSEKELREGVPFLGALIKHEDDEKLVRQVRL